MYKALVRNNLILPTIYIALLLLGVLVHFLLPNFQSCSTSGIWNFCLSYGIILGFIASLPGFVIAQILSELIENFGVNINPTYAILAITPISLIFYTVLETAARKFISSQHIKKSKKNKK